MGLFAYASLLASYAIPLAIIYLIASLLLNKYNALVSVPGPNLAAYSRLWRFIAVSRGSFHLESIALHRKYGKLVRIAPNVVSVSDPNEIAKIYSIKGGFTKTAFYPIQSITWKKRVLPNLFSARDEAQHREQRRTMANAYTSENLLKMEGAIDSCSKLFLKKMGDFADKKESVDLGAWLQYYAFDVISELTFSKKFGFLEQGADVGSMMKALEAFLTYSATIGQIPEAHNVILANPVLPILFPKMETWNDVVMYTLDAIKDRTLVNKNGDLEVKKGYVGDDMLSKWAAVQATDPLKMSPDDILVGLSTNVFAGSDTTAIALRAILYYLMKNPDKLAELREEIDTAAADGRISDPISDKEARALPYLNAVEKEAMRMHSSVGLILERHVPASGVTICDHFIPGGTIVGINPWVTQYDADIFEDPESFIPERWLNSTPEKLATMEKAFFAFGAGSRKCIGLNISLIEMRKIIPQLLRHFNIAFAAGSDAEWKVKNVWFVQQQMPLCTFSRRA